MEREKEEKEFKGRKGGVKEIREKRMETYTVCDFRTLSHTKGQHGQWETKLTKIQN